MLKSCVYTVYIYIYIHVYIFFYEGFVVPLLHRTSFLTRSDFKMIFQELVRLKFRILQHGVGSPLYSLYCGTVVMHS